MNTELIIIAFLIVAGFVALIFIFKKELQKLSEKKDDASITMLNQNMQGMHSRLDKAADVIGQLQRELGVFQEMGRGMQELQDLLRSPKARGNLGEQVLKDMLQNVLPPSNIKFQYAFKTGDKVDAIIKTKNGIIPIDSKFSLENFQKLMKVKTQEERESYSKLFVRDVKKHIDDISKKYILPSEGTVDFAIMYIPNEGSYNEITKNESLYHYGYNKRVYFVSPTNFYYFLQIVMQALENEKIEEKAKEVLVALRGIQQDSKKFGDDLSVLNKHVTNAKNTMDNVNSGYAKLGAKIEGTSRLHGSTKMKEINSGVDKEIPE